MFRIDFEMVRLDFGGFDIFYVLVFFYSMKAILSRY